MVLSDLTPIIAIIAVGLAVLALVALYILSRRLRRLHKAQKVVLGSRGDVDVVAYVASLEEKVANLRRAVEDLNVEATDHEVRIDGCLSRVGLVRFDAYHDLGGRQSTSVAFMDAGDNGIVLTTVVSRDFSRMYVKTIKDGQTDIALAPEETEAVDLARATAPFTIRPRLDATKKDEMETADSDAPAGFEATESAARALERENRRRSRQGLAPLDELPPAPSTLGWPKLQPLPEPELLEDDSLPEPDALPEPTEVTT